MCYLWRTIGCDAYFSRSGMDYIRRFSGRIWTKFALSIISRYWDCTVCWNHFSWNTRTSRTKPQVKAIVWPMRSRLPRFEETKCGNILRSRSLPNDTLSELSEWSDGENMSPSQYEDGLSMYGDFDIMIGRSSSINIGIYIMVRRHLHIKTAQNAAQIFFPAQNLDQSVGWSWGTCTLSSKSFW